MTPQVMLNRPAQRVPVGVKARASIGGEGVPQMLFGGAQRIRTVSPWKIQDIVLPEPEKERVEEKQNVRNRITEEERQVNSFYIGMYLYEMLMRSTTGNQGTSSISTSIA